MARLRADGRDVHEIDTGDLKTPEPSSRRPRRRPSRRCGPAPTSSSRRRSSTDVGEVTPTSSSGATTGRPSLGSWSYDVADTKLARRVKAAAILQMCVYADLLERLQGIAPETVSVVTGDGVAHPHRLEDYAAYYRAAKARFEARIAEDAAAAQTIGVRPRCTYLSGARRPLPGLPVVVDLHRSSPRRRPPLDRRGRPREPPAASSSMPASGR